MKELENEKRDFVKRWFKVQWILILAHVVMVSMVRIKR